MTERQGLAPQRKFQPDWVSLPGDTIADLLEERGWTQRELAQRTGFTPKHIQQVLKGRATISPEMAMRLEAVFGAPADFWLAREANYREAIERRRALDALRKDVGWLETLPLQWMNERRLIRKWPDKKQQVRECLAFFGVASVDAWRKTYTAPLAAYRASPKFPKKPGAVAAWIREGERQATALRCAPYDEKAFRAALDELRALTTEEEPARFVPRLVDTCRACGVSVVFVPAPKGCPVSGATRWLAPDKALVILSLRHKTNDHLWFTFFHEAAHLLLHSKKALYVDLEDGGRGQLEKEANAFAQDHLIPPERLDELRELAREPGTAEGVRRFSSDIGIAPGIVVGRMQRELWLPWQRLNDLKVSYDWDRWDEALAA